MIERFRQFPRALADRARTTTIPPGIPALLAHPDWASPAPTVVWLHGRTVSKELDPGRYLRWIRAGIAACAIDLPWHGERADPAMQDPAQTPDLLTAAIPEIDRVIESLADPAFAGAFDLDRLAIGGMSAGGMIALRRLCDEHPFRCASVECTTGWLGALYFPEDVPVGARAARPFAHRHKRERIEPLDPMRHLDSFRPIPLLALHSEADRVVPIAGQREFTATLSRHYASRGADPSWVRLATWPTTGAPDEHAGFGRVTNDAKTMQAEFFAAHLRPTPPPDLSDA